MDRFHGAMIVHIASLIQLQPLAWMIPDTLHIRQVRELIISHIPVETTIS